MSNRKIVFLTLVFVLLTAVKIAFPEQNTEFREKVKNLMVKNADYEEIIETMGKEMNSVKLRDEITAILELPKSAGNEIQVIKLETEG